MKYIYMRWGGGEGGPVGGLESRIEVIVKKNSSGVGVGVRLGMGFW